MIRTRMAPVLALVSSSLLAPLSPARAEPVGVGQAVVTLLSIADSPPGAGEIGPVLCTLSQSIGSQKFGCASPAYYGVGLSENRLNEVVADGFGDKANNWLTSAGVVFKDRLYMGVGGGLVLANGQVEKAKGAMVVRTADGETWETVSNRGFNDDPYNMFILELTVFDGFLYASTLNGQTGGQIWRTENGTDWEPVMTDGFGHIDNWAITDTEVFNGYLYAGTWRVIENSQCCGTELWRTRDPDQGWERVTQGYGEGYVNSDTARMLVHVGILYITVENWTNGLRVYRTSDGETFERIGTDGLGLLENPNAEGLIVYKDYLYVGTWNNGGPRLYRAPLPVVPDSFEPVGDPALFQGASSAPSKAMRLHRFGEYLIASVTNDNGEGGALYRSLDGENWEIVMRGGYDDRYGNSGASGQTIFHGSMYMGTYNREFQPQSTGTQIWRMDPPQNDLDNDAVAVIHDNCPTVFNPDQRDLDGDGVGAACDCDDTDPNQPGPTGCAVCSDADGDTYSPEGGVCGPVDCDDTEASIHPGAADPCDGVDQNCSGTDGVDADEDGYGAGCPVIACEIFACRGDCNDSKPEINPGAMEIPGNGIDDNCNGNIDTCGYVPVSERAAARLVHGLYALLGAFVYGGAWIWRRRRGGAR